MHVHEEILRQSESLRGLALAMIKLIFIARCNLHINPLAVSGRYLVFIPREAEQRAALKIDISVFEPRNHEERKKKKITNKKVSS